MRCPKCGNEMMIYCEFTEPVEDCGELVVESVIDLLCTDPQCPDGARGLPSARIRRRISGNRELEHALSCCGAPLAYVNETAYRIPDESLIEQQDADRVVLRCGVCGARHELIVKGKERLV